ncbi:putative receptor-like protein kinase At3g47110 [Camellia sinensis]|uniref:putative receptor-like protein kinase At3g47110 n=1 Tax=Camellia sinensis TaxID=4442 RepID=UPI0010360250|nr:putative receptor-like protein kinase At3g47110 [Camellia sinensis]
MANWLIIFFTSIVWWCCFGNTPATCLQNETDRSALIAFKSAIDQDPFGSLISWNDSVHYCDWNGILCSHRHPNRVVKLRLRSQGLVGSLSPHIGNLSFLKSLILRNNSFHGPIPQEIGRLFRLQNISLRKNSFHGEVPTNFSQCSNLEILDLIGNNLTGNIPAELGSLSKLTFLGLTTNKISGTIPPSLGNLSSLTQLFTGPLPISLSNASKLQQIGFDDNSFVGPMPRDLGRLLSLQKFGVGDNLLQDDLSFISSLTNCTSLKAFSVTGNFLRGPVPKSIANLSSEVSIIIMQDNEIYGSLPSGIGNLPNLGIFDMVMNHLSGPIPTTIGKLHNLHRLYLGVNYFTQLPSSIGNLTLLNTLYLGRNKIHGSIPSSLGNCKNLLDLNLAHNNFHGSIPPEIMSLSSISISFNLSYNALTGSLPLEVGSLKNLEKLDVSNNRLLGSIPNSLSNCLSLEWLHLEGNSFEGEIPQSLRELRGLQELDLSRNNLSGLIPSYLSELHLEKLNLSFNKLHGRVPMEGIFRNESAISVDGNNDLCGGIPYLRLPLCPSSKSSKNKLSHKMKVILAVVVVLVLCSILLGCLFIFLHWRRVSRKTAFSVPSLKHHLLRVSYAELLKATDGFSEDKLIGVGNYGSVYKGILDQVQTMVAVKALNLQLRGASKSFMSECKALRFIRHRNLLKILSACSSVDFQGNEFKALVYEFMANGSLEKWLHHDGIENNGQQESRNLKFIQRLNIAIDVASAIEYLHCHCDSTIIHGDLKPSNVLLDDEMIAHVGDFGLAKIISTISNEVVQHQSNSTAVRGTIGYVAPEYAMGNRASTIADVYSYGILLMEMFTGKRPTDNVFKDDLTLHILVESALPDQVLEIVDPRILSEHEPRSWLKDTLVSVLRIGVACSMESPRDRMQIQDVVNALCKIKKVRENNRLRQD